MKAMINKVFKHLPDYPHLVTGGLLIILGLTSMTGGGIGMRSTSTSDIYWINIGDYPIWIHRLMVVLGIDMALFRSKGLPFVFGLLDSRLINPIKKTIIAGIKDKEI